MQSASPSAIESHEVWGVERELCEWKFSCNEGRQICGDLRWVGNQMECLRPGASIQGSFQKMPLLFQVERAVVWKARGERTSVQLNREMIRLCGDRWLGGEWTSGIRAESGSRGFQGQSRGWTTKGRGWAVTQMEEDLGIQRLCVLTNHLWTNNTYALALNSSRNSVQLGKICNVRQGGMNFKIL